jgi:hypothetical protein
VPLEAQFYLISDSIRLPAVSGWSVCGSRLLLLNLQKYHAIFGYAISQNA